VETRVPFWKADCSYCLHIYATVSEDVEPERNKMKIMATQ